MQMHRQLRLRMTQGRQGGHSGQLPTLQIQTRPLVDITKWKLDGVARQIRRNRLQGRDHLGSGLSINFIQAAQTSLKPCVVHEFTLLGL